MKWETKSRERVAYSQMKNSFFSNQNAVVEVMMMMMMMMIVERGGSVVGVMPCTRKAAGSNPTLAATQGPLASPSLAVA